jgi:hypothetical protein
VDTTAILLISGALFLWCVLSGRLERDDLTAPIVFVAIGGMLAVTGLIDPRSTVPILKPLVEVTLVWVLFSDAAGVPPHEMRHGLGRIVRLLAVGLPLTVLAGWGLAYWLFPHLGIWLVVRRHHPVHLMPRPVHQRSGAGRSPGCSAIRAGTACSTARGSARWPGAAATACRWPGRADVPSMAGARCAPAIGVCGAVHVRNRCVRTSGRQRARPLPSPTWPVPSGSC